MQIQKQNESFSLLITENDTDIQTLQKIHDFLKAEKPDAKYNFKVQRGWESPYNYFTEVKKHNNQSIMKIMNGHLSLLSNFGINIEPEQTEFSEYEVLQGLQDIIKMMPFEPYDYQLKCTKDNLLNPKQISLASTSSGKSLIIFMMMYFLFLKGKRGIVCVPSISLTTQIYGDFKDYFHSDFSEQRDEFLSNIEIQGGGKESSFNSSLVISTWQSLLNRKEHLTKAEFILCDECLHPETEIQTINGKKQIQHLNVGEKVLTINEKTNKKEFNEIIKVHKNLSKEQMYEIETEVGTIRITGNHKILTDEGWVRADNITLTHNVISLNV